MGMSITQLLIILAIVIVLFGTKRLRNIGGDLGGAIKGFRSAIKDGSEDKKISEEEGNAIDSDVVSSSDVNSTKSEK
ncbi:MAG: Sec-independent protein translocase subunit TatA [Methylococcales bacterium]|jgi:sec-independent protein translocase protein TatA|nr:Sec-independent protein translocase subunit TatA [Methylococcaceae bacterium]